MTPGAACAHNHAMPPTLAPIHRVEEGSNASTRCPTSASRHLPTMLRGGLHAGAAATAQGTHRDGEAQK